MSKTTVVTMLPAPTLFGRLLNVVDRALMASARVAIRNGDMPHFGL
jgi:hypothetical protein